MQIKATIKYANRTNTDATKKTQMQIRKTQMQIGTIQMQIYAINMQIYAYKFNYLQK